MTWIKFVMFKTSFSEIFKYVCKKKNISFEIKIVIVLKSLAIEAVPNIERMLVIFF